MNLEVVKKFEGRDSQPLTIDANENYLVIGYGYGHYSERPWTAFFDVHSRHELGQNGMYQKLMVSELFWLIQL